MAERRMFAVKIVDSDAFLDMPLSTQALYFHLNMRADDDGFLNNPKRIQKLIGCADDDFKLLLAKRFILMFESGVIVIKHWKLHNYIRKDRYSPTLYQEEKQLISEKANGSYTDKKQLGIPDGNQRSTDGQPNDIPAVDVGKVRLGKDRLDKNNITGDKPQFKIPTIEEVTTYCIERGNDVNPQKWIDHYISNGWMVGKTKMKDWKAAVRTWETKNNVAKPSKPKKSHIEIINGEEVTIFD